MAKIYRGGVFGFGGMGQEFTTRINFDRWYGDDVQVVGACNRGEEKRKLAEERYGLKAFKDPAELVAMGLDFALVTSTTFAHLEHGRLCAEAGVPMLMEKPIALTYAEGKKLCAVMKKNNVETVVNFGRRFDPTMRKIKSILDEGSLGRLMSFEGSVYRGVGTYESGYRHRAVVEPEESGGWIVHHACHMVDVACWFCGEVDEVSVLTRSTVPGKFSEEISMARLTFKNGAIGSVIDTVAGVKGERLSIVGVNGGVCIREGAGVSLLNLRVQGDRDLGQPRVIDPRETHKFVDPLATLINIVRKGGKSDVSVHDAMASLRVTLAMRESAMQNGKSVKVSSIK